MFASSTLAESITLTFCQLWNLRRQKKRSSLVQLLFHVTLSGSPKKHCLSVRKSLELSHSKHGSLSIPGVRCSFLATCEHPCCLLFSDSSRLTNTNLIHFFVMRKIESEMVAAIYKNKNWCSGNTMVKTDDANISRVFLHGNHIATIDEDSLMIMDGGWQSKTTKSRLNALCSFFCYKGEYVFQKDFKWYVRKCVGAINGENVFKIDEFHSGYTFAWCLIDKNMCHSF